MRILLIESRMGRRKFFGFQQDPLGSQPPHQSSFLIPATREGGCDATKYVLLSYAIGKCDSLFLSLVEEDVGFPMWCTTRSPECC